MLSVFPMSVWCHVSIVHLLYVYVMYLTGPFLYYSINNLTPPRVSLLISHSHPLITATVS